MKMILRLLITAFFVLLAANFIPNIAVSSFYTAVVVAMVLGLVNLFIRPVLMILTFPINLLTLGLFTFVINAALLWFVATFVKGFTVEGFLAALLGSLVISLGSWVGTHLLRD